VGPERKKQLKVPVLRESPEPDSYELLSFQFLLQHEFLVIERGNSPGNAIVHAAESAKASMIVMGTRGLGLFRRTVLGSVSDYVVHHAGVPVLICHDHSHEKKHKH
jgi:nucleotide-binding universal stress UspA family protein